MTLIKRNDTNKINSAFKIMGVKKTDAQAGIIVMRPLLSIFKIVFHLKAFIGRK